MCGIETVCVILDPDCVSTGPFCDTGVSGLLAWQSGCVIYEAGPVVDKLHFELSYRVISGNDTDKRGGGGVPGKLNVRTCVAVLLADVLSLHGHTQTHSNLYYFAVTGHFGAAGRFFA